MAEPVSRTPRNETPPPLEQSSLFQRLLHIDAIAAVLLLAAAVLALVLANSPLHDFYEELWHIEFGLSLANLFEWEEVIVDQDLHHWINDGLMCIFFFVVGLEIKRELLVGELASLRRAMLPVAAAIGGMLCPALIYAAFNWNSPALAGWGIPMATDIAFAAGCLGILGRRIPPALSVFLVALAIVDDLGSVAVIAMFYTERIAFSPLVIGISLITISFAIARIGVRATWPYIIIGIFLWLAFLESGVHATIAGVLLAFTIPSTARYETPLFYGRMLTLLNRFRSAEDFANPRQVNARQQSLIRSMELECEHVEAPLQRIEFNLHPYTVFLIMPIFAFANSGLVLEPAEIGPNLLEPVTLGIIFGLIAGKQIGIMGLCWLAVRFGLASLPAGITWLHIYGVCWFASIGFTMSLFINGLAFAPMGEAGLEFIDQGKLGIFIASILSGIIGYLILRSATRVPEPSAEGAEEAGHHH